MTWHICFHLYTFIWPLTLPSSTGVERCYMGLLSKQIKGNVRNWPDGEQFMKGSPSDKFANWLTSCFNPYGHSKRSRFYPLCPYLAPLSWLLCIYEPRDSLLKPLIWPDAKLIGTLTTLVITPYGVVQKKI